MCKIIKINSRKEENSMVSVLDVAKWFLSQESMSNLKLQKLCYYAQAWHLVMNDTRLMDTTFEAWVHGPVSPQLYHNYKQWSWYDISKYTGNINLNSCTIEFLTKIYQLYGRYSGERLEEMTHNEKPWQNAREGYGPYEICDNIIDENDMKNYYRNLLER